MFFALFVGSLKIGTIYFFSLLVALQLESRRAW
jgi:hypothetical protein